MPKLQHGISAQRVEELLKKIDTAVLLIEDAYLRREPLSGIECIGTFESIADQLEDAAGGRGDRCTRRESLLSSLRELEVPEEG